MKFGLQHPNFSFDGADEEIFVTLRTRARSAEEGGFDSFWVTGREQPQGLDE